MCGDSECCVGAASLSPARRAVRRPVCVEYESLPSSQPPGERGCYLCAYNSGPMCACSGDFSAGYQAVAAVCTSLGMRPNWMHVPQWPAPRPPTPACVCFRCSCCCCLYVQVPSTSLAMPRCQPCHSPKRSKYRCSNAQRHSQQLPVQTAAISCSSSKHRQLHHSRPHPWLTLTHTQVSCLVSWWCFSRALT